MRVLLAGLFHETHCFVPERTALADFRIVRGNDLFAFRGNGSMIDGFLEVADAEGWEVVPAASYAATPSGMVTDAVVSAFLGDVDGTLDAEGPVDAVFLVLHGAMVAESYPDVEGAVLAHLRARADMHDVPVAGVFDLHATMTQDMARHADVLVSYRENPHTDSRESAMCAARLLARMVNEGLRPTIHHRGANIVWPPTGTGTADRPMRDLEALGRRIEEDHADIWAVNVVAGYSFADVPEAGVSFSTIGTAAEAVTDAVLNRLCAMAWSLRALGLPDEMTPEAAIAAAAQSKGQGPALLVEPSDNIGGGAPGNGTGVLRALIAAGVDNAGVVIADAEAVEALADLRPGEIHRLEIGGKDNPFDEGPVPLEVELISASDGRFELEDRHSHAVASGGVFIDMGPSAVVRSGGLTLLLTTRKTPPFDLGQWLSQGIAPEDFDIIGVKAAVAHRQAYDGIARASFTVSTPGPCASDPRQLPYRNLHRPAFPLDHD